MQEDLNPSGGGEESSIHFEYFLLLDKSIVNFETSLEEVDSETGDMIITHLLNEISRDLVSFCQRRLPNHTDADVLTGRFGDDFNRIIGRFRLLISKIDQSKKEVLQTEVFTAIANAMKQIFVEHKAKQTLPIEKMEGGGSFSHKLRGNKFDFEQRRGREKKRRR